MLLRAIFQMAKDDGLIDNVPNLRKWVATRTPPHQWLQPEQLDALLAQLPPHQQAMVLFAVHTGMRQSNVLGLTWDRVDLNKRLAWVYAIDTKANKTLSVPLNDVALAVLRGQLGHHPQFVFVYRGRPIKEIKTAFLKACVRAGLGEFLIEGESRRYRGLRWHDLRHFAVSLWIEQGFSIKEVMTFAGHSSIQMTMERYGHLFPSPDHQKAMAMVEAKLLG